MIEHSVDSFNWTLILTEGSYNWILSAEGSYNFSPVRPSICPSVRPLQRFLRKRYLVFLYIISMIINHHKHSKVTEPDF